LWTLWKSIEERSQRTRSNQDQRQNNTKNIFFRVGDCVPSEPTPLPERDETHVNRQYISYYQRLEVVNGREEQNQDQARGEEEVPGIETQAFE
jgi:hypothetical protein